MLKAAHIVKVPERTVLHNAYSNFKMTRKSINLNVGSMCDNIEFGINSALLQRPILMLMLRAGDK